MSLLQGLTASTVTVMVSTTLHDGGFALTAPGLLGKTIFTSPAVTQQILDSPEFDQLSAPDKAARILELALAPAAR